jgi:hypothetical protein
MMVDLGKAEIFKWHMPQTGHRVIGRDRAFADFLQQFAESGCVHLFNPERSEGALL